MTDWSKIVNEHGSLVWNTVFRLVNHDADAADCFQRTFLAAFELSGKESVRNWPAVLRRLAITRAIETLRSRYRHRDRMNSGANLQSAQSKVVSPGQAAMAAELADDLRAALAELDPRQAEVFWMVRILEMSYSDVAAETGLTVNHIGVLLNRARSSLRDRLRAHRPAEPEFKREIPS
jgi:RNA polymerase sigma factor (sigma-70 family)